MVERRWNAAEWLVDRHLDEGRGEAVALCTAEAELTFAALHRLVLGAATGLRRHAIGPGDRVALVLLDTPQFAATFLGCLRIGAIPVLVNPLLPASDTSGIVTDAGASLVLASSGREAAIEQLVTAAGAPPVVVLDDAGWAELTADTTRGAPHDTTAGSDGFWLCTSGSTGRPKLAMHRQGDLPITARTYAARVLGITADDRCYSVGPMFHAYGLGNSLTFPWSVGASTVLEAARPPTPTRVAEVVRAHRPTLFFGIPTFFAALNASDVPDDTFASVRVAVSAAEALPAETWQRFRQRFGVDILDGIGSTEMAHIVISNRPDAIRPGTSGWVVPGYQARVVDDNDVDRPAGESGYLLVKGDSAARGYWNQPEATKRTFGSAGGWVRTGDMYVRDESDCFTYLGRADDMLRVGGEWVSPAEVEATLIEHPDVLEVAVIGATDGLVTRVVAFVVPLAGHIADPEALAEHCRQRLAGFKRPKQYVVVDALPKTATGKIQRFKLRDVL